MVPLRYISGTSSTAAPATFMFLLLLLLDYDTLLSHGYVPDLALTSKKYYDTASAEEMALEEAALLHEKKAGESKSITGFITDLPTKLTEGRRAVIGNNLRKKSGMMVRITPRMIKYCARELKLSFQNELENEQLPEFSRILMKLNVSVLSPRIHNITLPRFSYKVLSNDTVEVRLRGGSARLLAFYRAVYRTIREGELEANLSSFATNLKFKVTSTFAGKLLLEDIVCGSEIRSIDIKLKPKLHELVDDGLRMELDETISVVICETLETYISKFEQRLNKLIRSPLIDVKINDTLGHLLIDTTISNDIILTEDYFDFPLLGTPTISKINNELHPLMTSPNDKSQMIYTYISEFVLNSFLKQLDAFGNIELLLNAEPEFQEMLQLNCSENQECMGDFLQDAGLYEPDSGRMIIKIQSPPVSSIQEDFALVNLNLQASVTYMQNEVNVKVLDFEWLVTVRISNTFLNEQLARKDEGIRKTNETLRLTELALSNMTPFVEMVPNFADHLLHLILLRKKALEKLLTKQSLLISVAAHTVYETVWRTGAFRNRTLMLATDLEWSPEHFSLFS